MKTTITAVFSQCFKFQCIVLFLGMLALVVAGSYQGLLAWVVGSGLALLGPGLMRWRLRPVFDGWPAGMWLWRLYRSVAIKWLLASVVLALYFMSGQAQLLWLGLGYGTMIGVQCVSIIQSDRCVMNRARSFGG